MCVCVCVQLRQLATDFNYLSKDFYDISLCTTYLTIEPRYGLMMMMLLLLLLLPLLLTADGRCYCCASILHVYIHVEYRERKPRSLLFYIVKLQVSNRVCSCFICSLFCALPFIIPYRVRFQLYIYIQVLVFVAKHQRWSSTNNIVGTPVSFFFMLLLFCLLLLMIIIII